MGSNHKTVRAMAVIYLAIGIVSTIIATFVGFKFNFLLGAFLLVAGIFSTISTSSLFYAMANIQENQFILAEALDKKFNLEIEY